MSCCLCQVRDSYAGMVALGTEAQCSTDNESLPRQVTWRLACEGIVSRTPPQVP